MLFPLYFFDPWGYKGLTLNLIREAITPFGCDCVFFFNFKRINAAIANEQFRKHIDALFGAGEPRLLGGESGFNARPMKEEWVIDIQTQCQRANVAFFFKQWGGVNKKNGRLLPGRTWDET